MSIDHFLQDNILAAGNYILMDAAWVQRQDRDPQIAGIGVIVVLHRKKIVNNCILWRYCLQRLLLCSLRHMVSLQSRSNIEHLQIQQTGC